MSNVRAWYLDGMVACDADEVKHERVVAKDKMVVAKDKYEVPSKLADRLKSIVADEFLAYITYKMCQVAMKGNKQHRLTEISESNGIDELDDHFKNLVDWMQSNGIKVVTSVDEMSKITNCTKFTVTDGMKTSEVVDILIKSEEEAISVYEKTLDDADVKYDLRTMLSGFLQDEREHLKKLTDVRDEMK